jgi:acyl-CoA thioester hydrolase
LGESIGFAVSKGQGEEGAEVIVSKEAPKGKEREATPRLSEFPVTVDFTVRWGDMDSLGHVNNVLYFRYFETARIAYFERLGIVLDLAKKATVGPILVSTRCDFMVPMVYPDSAVVGARVREARTTSLTMDYGIYRGPERALCAAGSSVIVLYDYEKKAKVPIPADMRGRIETLEGARRQPGG